MKNDVDKKSSVLFVNFAQQVFSSQDSLLQICSRIGLEGKAEGNDSFVVKNLFKLGVETPVLFDLRLLGCKKKIYILELPLDRELLKNVAKKKALN